MRMRRKKYLDQRLENCKSNLIVINREDFDFRNAEQICEYIDLSSYFLNDNPIFLEIGCGKGQFVCTAAKQNPNINYIAVERDANVIVSAAELAQAENIKNILFLKCSAEYLLSYLKIDSISRLFLNFSCPFPKKKYANHRLTAPRFLEIYRKLLRSDAEIHLKTDNKGLFEFSIEQLSFAGYTLKNISLDLHNSGFEDNIVTEYEQKFVSQGLPIYRLEAYLK